MNTSSWAFHNPVVVLYRPGAVDSLAEIVGDPRIALVTSPGFRRRGVAEKLERSFGQRMAAVIDDVQPNPDLHDVQLQADQLRPHEPEALVAVGGGSTIDTAKAVARLLGQPDGSSLSELLRDPKMAGPGQALPVVAVPSTAGTGAEVTPFGTVWDHQKKEKLSITGDDLYPRSAILDPELTLGLPEAVTVSSGLDAISHALESTWNRFATPVTLGLAARSLQLSMRYLPVVRENPDDIDARGAMLQASMLAGLAISQSRTALAHAISYPITANFDLPHGLACSFTLPALLAFNAKKDDGRLVDLAKSTGYAGPNELAEALSTLFERLDVGTHLRPYLPDQSSVLALADQMFAPGRAENNLRQASADDVRTLVSTALDALRI